jgi:hypothetical protein
MTALAHDTDSQLKGFTLNPPPEDGAAAWRSVQQAVDALARGETTHVNLDLQDFADRAHVVVSDLTGNPKLLARFRRLSLADFFEFAVIDRLTQHLPALWYVGHMQQEESDRPKRVSAKTLDDADQRRRRMHRVAFHYLEGDEDEAPRLKRIAFTNDQSKLANDLVTLADIYARHRALFVHDPHFLTTDEVEARNDSLAIRRTRGESAGTEVTWAERAAALFTIVQRDYKELRATGTWMLRDKPEDARARFPPMIERAARRSKDEASVDEGAAEEGGEATPANDAPTPPAPANDARTAEPAPAAPAEAKSPTPPAPAKKATPVEAKKPRAAKATKSADKKPARSKKTSPR